MRDIKVGDVVKLIEAPTTISIKVNNMLIDEVGNFFKVIKNFYGSYILAEACGKTLTYPNGPEIVFMNSHLKLEDTNYKQYNVGDTVRIRRLTERQMKDLEKLIYNGCFGVNYSMLEMAGNIYKITKKEGDSYKLNAPGSLDHFTWRSCWLIPKKVR